MFRHQFGFRKKVLQEEVHKDVCKYWRKDAHTKDCRETMSCSNGDRDYLHVIKAIGYDVNFMALMDELKRTAYMPTTASSIAIKVVHIKTQAIQQIKHQNRHTSQSFALNKHWKRGSFPGWKPNLISEVNGTKVRKSANPKDIQKFIFSIFKSWWLQTIIQNIKCVINDAHPKHLW